MNFITITEYQLLFLARQELSRRIDEIETALKQNQIGMSKRRATALLRMYAAQLSEISDRMDEINERGGSKS